MFVILSYDVGSKRLRKVLRVCRRYLRPVHKSVFEGNLTESELRRLKGDLIDVVDVRHDAVCIYRVAVPQFVAKDQLGLVEIADEVI